MRLKKAISWLLSAAMVLSMTSLPASVKAADTEADHQLESPQYIVNITGTDLVKAGMDETKMQALIDGGQGERHILCTYGKGRCLFLAAVPERICQCI